MSSIAWHQEHTERNPILEIRNLRLLTEPKLENQHRLGSAGSLSQLTRGWGCIHTLGRKRPLK